MVVLGGSAVSYERGTPVARSVGESHLCRKHALAFPEEIKSHQLERHAPRAPYIHWLRVIRTGDLENVSVQPAVFNTQMRYYY